MSIRMLKLERECMRFLSGYDGERNISRDSFFCLFKRSCLFLCIAARVSGPASVFCSARKSVPIVENLIRHAFTRYALFPIIISEIQTHSLFVILSNSSPLPVRKLPRFGLYSKKYIPKICIHNCINVNSKTLCSYSDLKYRPRKSLNSIETLVKSRCCLHWKFVIIIGEKNQRGEFHSDFLKKRDKR